MTGTNKVAYIFPGQGSQTVGMGKDLYDKYQVVKDIFNKVNEVLDFPLSRLCFEGPEDDLRQTINAQPALVTVSYACLTVARENAGSSLPSPAYVAGHSLGEYTALIAANVLDFSTTVRLARERGRLMTEAAQQQTGGMAAILGLDETTLTTICKKTGTTIANYNSPGQMVISGSLADLSKASELALANGAKRVVPLQVSGAFHSPLMLPAQEGLSKILAEIEFNESEVPLIANTSAKPLSNPDEMKSELTEQLTNSVRWQQSVEYMVKQGVSTFYEMGSGKILSGLNKRINSDIITYNLSDARSIEQIGNN